MERVPPSVNAAFQLLVRFRWWGIAALAIGRALSDGTSGLYPVDFFPFEKAGRLLLSSHWFNAYDFSFIQTGVLSLALHGGVGVLHDLTGISARIWFSLATQVGITVLAIAATRRAARHIRGSCPEWLELLVGLVVLVSQLSWHSYISGHPADGAVALLWVLAALDAREGRPVRSGLMLALAGGFKQWGVLGAPVLLLSPGFGRSLKGWAVQLAATAFMYGPFFMFGDVQTFEMKWSVGSVSLPRLFLAEGSTFSWWMRVVQGAFVLVIGAIAAQALRRRRTAIWTLPLILVLARLISEPFTNYYHWSALDLISLVGVGVLLLGGSLVQKIALGVALYVELLVLFLPAGVGLAYHLLFAASLVIAGIGSSPREEPPQPRSRSSTIPSPASGSG